MRRILAVGLFWLAFAGPATAGDASDPGPAAGSPPSTVGAGPPELTDEAALDAALASEKVGDWVARYPSAQIVEDASFDRTTRSWRVRIWAEEEQIVLARVSDETGLVTEAWTGPQVAWTMARGIDGAFGRKINDPAIWFGFAALFLIGLARFRRPLSLHNLDLLVLVSFTASLWFFNRGEIFTSVPLAYPPLVYLLGRMLWISLRRGRRLPPPRLLWPTPVLLVAVLFVIGFRIGLNLEQSNVIDVGYAGVIGAERIVSEAQSPYGHFPVRRGEECGEPDGHGVVRDRIQTNGRCESSNEHGDTYGPINYLAYAPAYVALGWSGTWDDLPAAHASALIFDLTTMFGLALVGWRFGRARLATILVFVWAAFPFTQYVSNTNANDALVPALLVLGFWAATSAPARGFFVGLAAWTKFAPLVLAPLWLSYPRGVGRPRPVVLFVGGFALASALGFWVLLLEPDPVHAARVFWDRTFGWQLDRESPFSLWGWERYGYADLGWLHSALRGLLVVGALLLAVLPRRKSPLQLAGLSAALLIGFQLTLTHWSYLYIPWFLPFVAFVMFWRAGSRSELRPWQASYGLAEPTDTAAHGAAPASARATS